MIESTIYLQGNLRESHERLHGSLLNQAMRRELHNPHWIMVNCESSVQTQETLLAGNEYRLWLAEHGLPYRAIERYHRILRYGVFARGLCGVRKIMNASLPMVDNEG